MEACPGSQWLARKLQAFANSVRIIPAQFVNPYVKSNKNDTVDAAAIAKAATRSTMRFVEVKNVGQAELQALQRIRDRMVANRTRLICRMRGLCLELVSSFIRASASSGSTYRACSAIRRTI